MNPRQWIARPFAETVVVTAFFALLTLGLFAGCLFGPGDQVLGIEGADMDRQFLHWRAFAQHALAHGHFPLWNPHIYGGTQYFGGFQSALLYPPNALYLILPLPLAVDAGIALHVFLAGWFTYFWVRRCDLHPVAAVLAGVLFMLSGTYFFHIIAGHLPNLCAMVWGPLILLAIDGWIADRRPRWLLLGSLALALQILAGHPQYVFYTGVACAIYSLARLARANRRLSATLGLAFIPIGGLTLGAVQLLEGLHASGESLRSKGTSISFAGSFSFPPENFLTFLTPHLFGDIVSQPYWGRHLLWEMCPFIGVTGLVLVGWAVTRVRGTHVWVCAGTAAILFLLAAGRYTPLFEPLYYHAPGFDKFRGWSKFIYPATLFLVMLAAVGFDDLLRHGLVPRFLPPLQVIAAALLLAAGTWSLWSAHSGTGDAPAPWAGWVQWPKNTGEAFNQWEDLSRPDFVQAAARCAGRSLLTAGFTLAAIGLILGLSRRYRVVLIALPIVALAELLVFAAPKLVTLERPLHDSSNAHADRVLNLADPDAGMSSGENDLWGYDPGVTRRYAELMARLQGLEADDATQDLRFTETPELFARLLRCRGVFDYADTAGETAETHTFAPAQIAPHVRLVGNAQVTSTAGAALDATVDPSFDPTATVVLETPPDPAPSAHVSGHATVTEETTDTLTIEASTPEPAVLLITDAYSDGWHARSLLPSGVGNQQTQYRVMPADYALRAIPLAAGRHRIVLEYRPKALVIGAGISTLSLLLWIGTTIHFAKRRIL